MEIANKKVHYYMTDEDISFKNMKQHVGKFLTYNYKYRFKGTNLQFYTATRNKEQVLGMF